MSLLYSCGNKCPKAEVHTRCLLIIKHVENGFQSGNIRAYTFIINTTIALREYTLHN